MNDNFSGVCTSWQNQIAGFVAVGARRRGH